MELLIGIAIGAAFSPFWMKVWAYVSPKLWNLMSAKKDDK